MIHSNCHLYAISKIVALIVHTLNADHRKIETFYRFRVIFFLFCWKNDTETYIKQQQNSEEEEKYKMRIELTSLVLR